MTYQPKHMALSPVVEQGYALLTLRLRTLEHMFAQACDPTRKVPMSRYDAEIVLSALGDIRELLDLPQF